MAAKPYLSVAVITTEAPIAAVGTPDVDPCQIPLPRSAKEIVTGLGTCALLAVVYVIFAETDVSALSSVIDD